MTPITVGTTGLPTASLSATLPNGLGYVDNGNGTITISGTPAAGTAGSGKTLTITATNAVGTGSRTSAAFSINGPPTFVNGSTDSTTFITTQSTSTFYQIPTTGFPIPTVSVVVGSGSLPAGVTLNASRQLIGKPTVSGVFTFTLRATNTAGSVDQVFTLTVNAPPTVNTFTVPTLTEGVAMTPITVGTTGFPTPSLSATLPSGLGYVDNGNGTITISGTPDVGTAGSGKTITITATNGAGTVSRTSAAFSINGPPKFANGNTNAVTITVGQSVGTTTGTNPTAPRVVVSGFPVPALKLNGLSGSAVATGVTGVTINTTTGFFSGTPAANTAGVYTLTFTATATGQPTATQILTLTVNPPASTAGAIGYLSQKVAANGTGTTWAPDFMRIAHRPSA
ncbi:MAG: putative Ig domain-containing protein [Gemmataceae bacterium]